MPTQVEIVGWGERVTEVMDRLEMAFFVLVLVALLMLFTLTFMAIALVFRR